MVLRCSAAGLALVTLTVLAPSGPVSAAERRVGPGKEFDRVESALAIARAGDVILVYPRGGQPSLMRGRLCS